MAFDKEAYFKALEQIMDKFDRHLGELKTPIQAFICGGSALMYWLDEARLSMDVDAFFSHQILRPQNVSFPFSDEYGNAFELEFDYNFHPQLSMFHPDYADKAKLIMEFPNLQVFVLAPLDVAIMKISRFNSRDQFDLELLVDSGLLSDAEELRTRTEEALKYYVGNDTFIKIALDEICEKIADKREQNSEAEPK